ncbi:MAG: FecR domain-containing protein [Polyangiaceae bacterium]|nr:FecR domain-containing protein [Polyangiaceae bacterium]
MGRRLLAAVFVACVLVALGMMVERALHQDADSAASRRGRHGALGTAANPPPAERHASTLEVHGTVERRSEGGSWQSLNEGDPVDINDEVRTGPSSTARLQLGPQVTVELAGGTGINVAQLSETLSRIRLQDGRVVSEVRGGAGFRFRVQVQGNNAQAESGAGRFAVLRRAGAPAVFAAEQGTLDVTGSGDTVSLHPGEQTQVVDGGAPSAPTRIPTSLLLKLGRPPPSRLRTRQVAITGQTSPGAVVHAGGAVAAPDAAGQFSMTVALVDGPNEIVVEVEDVAGRRQQAKLPRITVDTHPPHVAGKVLW